MKLIAKVILPLFLLVFNSCENDNSQPLAEKDFISFNPRLGDTLVTAKGFECGTSDLIDDMLTGPAMPKNYKKIGFITTKKKVYSFLSVAEKNSFVFNAFDIDRFKEFYIPTENDSMWLTLPVATACVIQVNITDSFPATVSYNVDGNKQFRFSIETDSTIANKLLNIMVANKLGRLTSRI